MVREASGDICWTSEAPDVDVAHVIATHEKTVSAEPLLIVTNIFNHNYRRPRTHGTGLIKLLRTSPANRLSFVELPPFTMMTDPSFVFMSLDLKHFIQAEV